MAETYDSDVDSANLVVCVMPAYNVASTLQETFIRIPPGVVDSVVLVDNASSDGTVALAKRLQIDVIRHPHNAGYGGNQKTGYIDALRKGAGVVVMLHADGQYDPTIVGHMVEEVKRGHDVVFGSRFLVRGGARAGGMPFWRLISNRCLTTVENFVMGTSLSECHTGYRAYSRRFLETVPFLHNSNGYVFDTQIMFQAAAFGFKIKEIPVKTRYFADASSPNFVASTLYGLSSLGVALRFVLHRIGFKSRLFSRP